MDLGFRLITGAEGEERPATEVFFPKEEEALLRGLQKAIADGDIVDLGVSASGNIILDGHLSLSYIHDVAERPLRPQPEPSRPIPPPIPGVDSSNFL
jgi:hypothetical protein